MAAQKKKKEKKKNVEPTSQTLPQLTLESPEALQKEMSQKVVSLPLFWAGLGGAFILGILMGSLASSFSLYTNTKTPSQSSRSATEQQTTSDAVHSENTAQGNDGVMQDSQLQQLIADKEKALLSDPNNAELWIQLGNLYFDTAQSANAVKAYERALQLSPNNVGVMTDLGIMYREVKKPEKAVAMFRQAVAIQPNFENAWFNLGVVLNFDLHKHKEARTAWERLLSINPAAKAPNGHPVQELIKTIPE